MSRDQHILDILTGEACWVVVKFSVKYDTFNSNLYHDPKIIEKISKKYTIPQIWRICKWIVSRPDRKNLYHIADCKDITRMVDIMTIYTLLKWN